MTAGEIRELTSLQRDAAETGDATVAGLQVVILAEIAVSLLDILDQLNEINDREFLKS